MKIELFEEYQSLVSLNFFRHQRIVYLSLIFSFVGEKINEEAVLNILSMDNSIFNSWDAHCSWTKVIQLRITNYELRGGGI